MKKAVLVLSVVFLCGCGLFLPKPTPEQLSAGPYPTNYRQMILDHLSRSMYDPDSLRNFSIFKEPHIVKATFLVPRAGMNQGEKAWKVSYYCNAKNRFGGYTGNRLYSCLIRHNRLVYCSN